MPNSRPLTDAELASFDEMPDGWMVVHEGRLVHANSQLKLMMGCAGGEVEGSDIVGSPIGTFVDAGDRYALMQYCDPAQVQRSPGQPVRVVLGRDMLGHSGRHVRLNPYPVNWRGEPAVATVVQDITEDATTQQHASELEAVFRCAFRHSPDLMLLTTPDLERVIEVSQSVLNTCSLRRDELIDSSLTHLEIWADKMFLSRFSREIGISASITDMPTTLRVRGGVVRPFKISAHKLEHQLDGQQMLLITGRDVSHEPVHQRAMQESVGAAQSEGGQNKTGQGESGQSKVGKTEFLAAVNHELRTPLNGILGFSEIMKNETMGPIGSSRYLAYASDIHICGLHLLSTINAMLDLSKIEADEAAAHFQWLNPYDAIAVAVHAVEGPFADAGVTLKAEIANALLIKSDGRMIKQICVHLLSGALKATLAAVGAGGSVSLSFGYHYSGGAALTITHAGGSTPPADVTNTDMPFVAALADKMGARFQMDHSDQSETRTIIYVPSDLVTPEEGIPEAVFESVAATDAAS